MISRRLLVSTLIAGVGLPAVAGAEIRRNPGSETPLPTAKYVHVVSEADSPVQQVYIKSKDGLYIAAALRIRGSAMRRLVSRLRGLFRRR